MSQQTADLLIVARMRDEASQQMERLGDTVSRTEFEALQAQAAFTAMGSALTAVGSLLNQIDDPAAKMAANFISIGGAILATAGAIGIAIPQVLKLVTALKGLVTIQTLLVALTGPLGLAVIAAAIGVTAGVTAAINASPQPLPEIAQLNPQTAARIAREQGIDLTRDVKVEIEGAIFLNDDRAMGRFADAISEVQRRRSRGTVGVSP